LVLVKALTTAQTITIIEILSAKNKFFNFFDAANDRVAPFTQKAFFKTEEGF
jgi:hypothetical protein